MNPGEEVVLDLRPHWRFFLRPALLLVLAIVGFVVGAVLDLPEAAQVALAAVTLAALCWFVVRYARWATTSFVVTTDRLIHRSGVLAKRGIEIPLENVQTVFSSQSLLERLLRCGDLVIESGGERGRQVVRDVPGPDRVKSTISRAMEEDQRRAAGWAGPNPAASPPPVTEASVLDQIDQLDQLRQRGVISQVEFDAKKAQLLERL